MCFLYRCRAIRSFRKVYLYFIVWSPFPARMCLMVFTGESAFGEWKHSSESQLRHTLSLASQYPLYLPSILRLKRENSLGAFAATFSVYTQNQTNMRAVQSTPRKKYSLDLYKHFHRFIISPKLQKKLQGFVISGRAVGVWSKQMMGWRKDCRQSQKDRKTHRQEESKAQNYWHYCINSCLLFKGPVSISSQTKVRWGHAKAE